MLLEKATNFTALFKGNPGIAVYEDFQFLVGVADFNQEIVGKFSFGKLV